MFGNKRFWRIQESLSGLGIILIAILPTLAIAQSWTEPVQISHDLGLLGPRAVTVGDTIHVAANGQTRIYYQRSADNGRTWTEPYCPADTFYGSQSPDIAYSDGILHILWKAYIYHESNQIFHYSSSDGGLTWSEPHQVFDNDDNYLQYCRLAVSGDTIFASCSNFNNRLIIRSYDAGVTWSDPMVAEDQSSRSYPATIMYVSGRLHIAYQGTVGDTTGVEIYYRYSDDHGETWSDRVILSTPEPIPNMCHSQRPSAYADSNGNITVIWFDYKYGSLCGITGDMLGRVSIDNGETWLPEMRLTYTQGGSHSSCLIIDDVIYAIWMDRTESVCDYSKITYAESADWGSTWSEPVIISGSIPTSEFDPFLLSNDINGETVLHCVMRKYPPDGGYELFYFNNTEIVGIKDNDLAKPDRTYLGAYPNPFNTSTIISYQNLTCSNIEIYDICGRLVKILHTDSNYGSIAWNATNETGKRVSSGIYFARAMTDDGIVTARMIYLK